MHPVEPRFDKPVEPTHIRHTWYHKLGIFLFIIVCFEVGAFLTVFPWTPQWESNSVANLFRCCEIFGPAPISGAPSAVWGCSISTSRSVRCHASADQVSRRLIN